VKVVNVGLLLWCIASAAQAGEAIDKTLAVKADGLVRIDNVRGRIEVQGWDRSDVMVKGTLDDQAKSFTFETSGSTTTVKVETPDNLNRGKGSDLVIHVPSASRVRIDLVSADLSMQGLHGGVDGRTVSGEIDARDLSGTIVIGSVSGGISVTGAAGPTTFNSVSGAIEAQTDAEQIKIATVSGDAQVRSGARLKELTLHSVSGNLDVNSDLADGAQVKGSTTSGYIRLTVNPDVGAVVDLRTTSSGIKNQLSSDRPTHEMSGGGELDATIGNGSGVIELTSISGRLELLAR
jgi:DUF4097 and DUF4098 domain-containing protein YvlB